MRRAAALLLLLCLLVALSGCAAAMTDPPPEEPAEKATVDVSGQRALQTHEPLVLKLAVSTGDEDPCTVSARAFAEAVGERTGGQIQIQVNAASLLGEDEELILSIVKGEGQADIVIADAAAFCAAEPDMGVSALPFLFADYEDAWAFLDGPAESAAEEKLLEKGIRVLAHYDGGFHCMTNSVRPIMTPADLEGLTVSCPIGDSLTEKLLLAFGANPRPLRMSELYPELMLGSCDGQENTIAEICRNRLYEVQTYLAVTNRRYSALCLAVSEQAWNCLSSEERLVLTEEAAASAEANRDLSREKTESLLAELAGTMELTSPDLTLFRTAAESIYTENPTGISEAILAMLP